MRSPGRLMGLCAAFLAACVEPPPEPALDLRPELELTDFPPAPETLLAEADSWYADCGNGLVFAMGDLLPSIAEAMARQKIPYAQTTPDEWRDCSGNFLRLSSYLAAACPAGIDDLAAPPGVNDYVRGGPNDPGLDPVARNSRELARWYLDQGRFVPVWYDEVDRSSGMSVVLDAYRYLLKPGAVLWFARSRPLEKHGMDQLFSRNARGTGIHHVGVVVGSEVDEDGFVTAYSMYHAGNGSRAASITDDHRERGAGGGPPFGNGGEYLVGIGTLLPLALPPP